MIPASCLWAVLNLMKGFCSLEMFGSFLMNVWKTRQKKHYWKERYQHFLNAEKTTSKSCHNRIIMSISESAGFVGEIMQYCDPYMFKSKNMPQVSWLLVLWIPWRKSEWKHATEIAQITVVFRRTWMNNTKAKADKAENSIGKTCISFRIWRCCSELQGIVEKLSWI